MNKNGQERERTCKEEGLNEKVVFQRPRVCALIRLQEYGSLDYNCQLGSLRALVSPFDTVKDRSFHPDILVEDLNARIII
jgi:hypothetical protein